MIPFAFSTPIGVANVGEVAFNTALLLLAMLFPLALFAITIHWIEYFTFRNLARQFGWRVVLWTGWLGTPIHELSHAVMCKLFHHRIDELVLFEPDREAGRLGYVRHSYRTGNWFEEVGNVFIGIAPLIGGSLVLAGLLWLFYRDAAAAGVAAAGEAEGIARITETTRAILASIFRPEHFSRVSFWVFLYLVLCVGLHMAPSGSDYRGSARGWWMVGGTLFAISLLLVLLRFDVPGTITFLWSLLTPLYAVLFLAAALCAVAAAAVWLITGLLGQVLGSRTVR